MFWADAISEEAQKRYKDKIKSGKPLIVRDEKTASGRVHVGSLRGVAIHGAVSQVLSEGKIKNKYLFEINDYDPMDGLPVYLDEKKFKPYMGKPLCNVPSPDDLPTQTGKAKNYAEYFAEEFTGVIGELDFHPEYYRSSDLYKSGKYNDTIKMALDGAGKIREIYKEVSGAVKDSDWLPLSVICEKCGNVGSTKAKNWNGKTVDYECGDFVEWAKGCGHKGTVSPYDGKAKLPWKVEWAAKFTVLDVDIEGGGKDHSTKGGSRQIADAISREVFKREPPINIPYEFFNVGGKKMSSSKGKGSSSREIADLLPPEILRFLLLQKEPRKAIDFDPEGDTIPILFDTYDTYAKDFYAGKKDDFARVFSVVHSEKFKKGLQEKVLPRFSIVAYLTQMPHVDMKKEVEKNEGVKLGKLGEAELEKRAKYAKLWLDSYAPENFKFEIQKELPEQAKSFTESQKKALAKVAEFMESQKGEIDGQTMHSKLHEIKTELGITPKEFFEAIYFSILGRASGPKAGWFLSVLDKKFVIDRFIEVVK